MTNLKRENVAGEGWQTIADDGGGSQTVLSTTVTLTDAQIKALPTTTPTLVAAPGAGLTAIPMLVVVKMLLADDYTNLDAALLMLVKSSSNERTLFGFGPPSSPCSDFLAAGGDTVNFIGQRFQWNDIGLNGQGVTALDLVDLENKAHVLLTDNAAAGDFTGGNAANSMVITTLYTVI